MFVVMLLKLLHDLIVFLSALGSSKHGTGVFDVEKVLRGHNSLESVSNHNYGKLGS